MRRQIDLHDKAVAPRIDGARHLGDLSVQPCSGRAFVVVAVKRDVDRGARCDGGEPRFVDNDLEAEPTRIVDTQQWCAGRRERTGIDQTLGDESVEGRRQDCGPGGGAGGCFRVARRVKRCGSSGGLGIGSAEPRLGDPKG